MILDDRRRLGQAMKAARLSDGSRLPIAARFIALAIWSHRNRETGTARPGMPALVDITGVHDERAARRLIRQLEEAGIVETRLRTGQSSVYFFPGFPGLTPGLTTPGPGDPEGSPTPGPTDPPGSHNPGPVEPSHPGSVGPPTPGLTDPPEPLEPKSMLQQQQPDLPPTLVILRGKLDRAGLIVRWDTLAPTDIADIERLVDIHGDTRLVQAALRERAAHADPPAYAKAWLRVWAALPDLTAGRPLSAVPDLSCPVPGHGHQPAGRCPDCDTAATPAPANWRTS